MEGQSLSCVRGIVRGESFRRAFCNASEAGRANVSDATFVAPNFTRYRAVSREVREIFNRHTDLIEPLSLEETYLDVTTNKTGLPTGSKITLLMLDFPRAGSKIAFVMPVPPAVVDYCSAPTKFSYGFAG
jgi:nucleotidyltransferase/DNA polymerase involved in DNA repair